MPLTNLRGPGQSHAHNDMAPNLTTAEAEERWSGSPRGALSLGEMFPAELAIAFKIDRGWAHLPRRKAVHTVLSEHAALFTEGERLLYWEGVT